MGGPAVAHVRHRSERPRFSGPSAGCNRLYARKSSIRFCASAVSGIWPSGGPGGVYFLVEAFAGAAGLAAGCAEANPAMANTATKIFIVPLLLLLPGFRFFGACPAQQARHRVVALITSVLVNRITHHR